MTEDVGGIVLAAGYSSRAGMYKMTCDLEGKTLIERCIDGMAAFCSEIIVVGGYRTELLEYLPGKYDNLRLICNTDYRQGMLSSVVKGVSSSTTRRIFVTPGDYPLIQPHVYERMLLCKADIIIPSYFGMEGHPVLMNRGAAAVLLSGNFRSLSHFIQSYGYATVTTGDAGILTDLDTRSDYDAIRAFLRKKEAEVCGTYHNRPCR